jgi:putative phosphoesterase
MPAETPFKDPQGPRPATIRVGVLSDTHGYLNPAIASIFSGVEHIVHTGDVESPEILAELARTAPITPIRGNMDFGGWASQIPREEMLTLGDVTIYALHDLSRLALDPEAAGIDVVLSGHTHKPEAYWQGPRLFLNPGSASYPRAGRSPSVAVLTIEGARIRYRFVDLEAG